MSAATDIAAPGLERCFLFEATETSYRIAGIEGSIPTWLRGAYYVNGPARFERPGLRYKHWLDGDGMICALHFDDEGVRFASRFVETPKLRDERAANAFLYRGFGTAFANDKLRRGLMLEPPVNVSVYRYDGRLLAFGEQSLPYDLDPETLETRGEYDFHGKLNPVSPFAAHAKFDGGHLINFGVQFSSSQPVLNVYEFDGAGGLLRRRRHALKLPHSLHDFGFTASSFVFFLSPLLMNFDKFLAGGVSVMESLTWEPDRGSEILVIPRDAQTTEAFSVRAGNGYCLHLINAFETDRQLHVDILELDEPVYKEYQPIPDVFSTVRGCRPVRFVIDLATRALIHRFNLPYEHTPDFPAVHPNAPGRRYDDFWMLGISAAGQPGRKFFDELAHGNWSRGAVDDIYQVPAGEYLGGEPVCVANRHNDKEACVIVEHFITGRDACEFLIFDANRVAAGPVARLPLRHRIHPGFHSSFHAEVCS